MGTPFSTKSSIIAGPGSLTTDKTWYGYVLAAANFLLSAETVSRRQSDHQKASRSRWHAAYPQK